MSRNIPVVLEKRLTGDTAGPEHTEIIAPNKDGVMVAKKVEAQKTDQYGTVLARRQTLPNSETQKRGEGTVREDFA